MWWDMIIETTVVIGVLPTILTSTFYRFLLLVLFGARWEPRATLITPTSRAASGKQGKTKAVQPSPPPPTVPRALPTPGISPQPLRFLPRTRSFIVVYPIAPHHDSGSFHQSHPRHPGEFRRPHRLGGLGRVLHACQGFHHGARCRETAFLPGRCYVARCLRILRRERCLRRQRCHHHRVHHHVHPGVLDQDHPGRGD